MNILMVEDDYLDAMNVQRAFNKLQLSHNLHIARNGRAGLDMLTGSNGESKIYADIILLDLNMPKMNGLEFLKELRGNSELKHSKVFIVTTSDEEAERETAKKLGIEGYIIKPLSFDRFDNPNSSMDNFNLLIDLMKA
jgi:CheY-like chemotaxis protein